VFFWHHSDRAAFGLITLAFVASGLVLRNSGASSTARVAARANRNRLQPSGAMSFFDGFLTEQS
jgi:hypothetical protein